MTFLGSSAKIPELLRFKTLGTLILNEEVVAETVPVLMAALKQAISKIESLEARIATLEGS